MSGSKAEKMVHELLDKGCPQCGQKEEFSIRKEKWSELRIGVFSEPGDEVQYTTSDDEDEEHFILCPDCGWEKDIL